MRGTRTEGHARVAEIWKPGDNARAMRQGWLLAWNTDERQYEIQRFDEAGGFASDHAALEHVMGRAARRAKVAGRALEVIRCARLYGL